MCGIAGFAGSFDPDLLGRMADAIAHRGPDDAGVWHDPEHRIGLAHRRLSIIDLSPRGHQPMWDVDRRAVIVFNGEIYNYRELRAELVSRGFRFHSNSDTEVLLNLYLDQGAAMLPRLNGIYAFALWDTRDHSLLVARDGLGVKPLYLAETPRGVLFASELKALLHEPTVGREIDPVAVHHHLLYLWCPSPRTMLRSVRKLEAGHALRIEQGSIARSWRFYELPYDQPIEAMGDVEAARQVRAAVKTAVSRQMVADVPVGAFLSGGLDSSSVVAFAREEAKDGKLQCFTIGFDDAASKQEGMTADLPYAERVAATLGVDLHTIRVGPEMVDELPRVLFHLDEPQADPAPINALFICRLARERGIKVLLSGAGGDDIFTGYRRHFALGQESRWGWLPSPARRGLRALAQTLPKSSPALRRIAKAFQYANLEGDARIASYFYWIDPALLGPISGPAFREAGAERIEEPLVQALRGLPPGVPALNRMLYLDSRYFLVDHNLNYTDKVSMANGVEVRVPLLDPDLVSLAARLPLGMKQRGRVGKWVFKEAMEGILPRDVIHREKTGFGAPLRDWLRGPLRPLVEDVLAQRSIDSRGLFDAAAVQRLVALDRAGSVDAAYTIFAMLCIELWCRMFVDSAVPAPL